jgi:hypothetical protein
MAGSLNHIVGTDGRFSMDLIENPAEVREALEECFRPTYVLAEGNSERIGNACDTLGFTNPWKDEYGVDPKDPMRLVFLIL